MNGQEKENPYQSPVQAEDQIVTAQCLPEAGTRVRDSFSHQAAKFSLFAPLVVFLLGTCLNMQMTELRGNDTGRMMAFALAGISLLTTLAAFTFGFVGIVGGIRRGAARTIIYAILGLIVNGGILGLWVWTIVLLTTIRRAPH
jgi:hypothetical protein